MARTSVRLYANKSVIIRADDPTSRVQVDKYEKYYLSAPIEGTSYGIVMLLGFDPFPEALKNQRLYDVSARVCLYSGAVRLLPLLESFDPETVTWETKPSGVQYKGSYTAIGLTGGKWDDPYTPEDVNAEGTTANIDYKSYAAKAFVLVSAAQATSSNNQYALHMREMLAAGTEPYVDIYYDDAVTVQSKIEQTNSPIDGYYNPRGTIQFQWDYVSADETYFCAGSFTQASAVLHWRASGSEEYSAINISGTATTFDVPANTFPAGTTIEWYLEGTDTAGTTSQTEVYSFSTAAGNAVATLKSPINSVEDGTAPITITWALSSSDGQTPIAVDLWWKRPEEDNNQWHTLLSHAEASISYTVPAGTFPSGEIQLIVRAYNVDDVAGAWSRPSSTTYYSFISVAAPDPVQGLAATSVPRTTISWQSTGQQGFEITIDGQVAASEYGPDVMRWQVQSPLSDGQHTISVRVQGMYSLWSQPSTITVAIQNDVPEEWENITITGAAGVDAQLALIAGEADLSAAVVHWYRDGTEIGRTSGQTVFADRFVLGNHVYYAELVDSSGNYKRTNSINLFLSTSGTVIAPFSGGEWMSLPLTDNEDRVQIFEFARTAKARPMLGAKYPVLELSAFNTLVGTYDCAFKSVSDAAGLEALKGQIVIVKSREGQVIIGGLLSMQRTIHHYYVSYSFSVEQIDWEDFVQYGA